MAKSILTFYLKQLVYTGFPKVDQVVPLGAMTDTQGAINSKVAIGGAIIFLNFHKIFLSCK